MERFLLLAEVENIHPVSRQTRWRMVRAGSFPAPIRISAGRIGWRESDILKWVEAKRSGEGLDGKA